MLRILLILIGLLSLVPLALGFAGQVLSLGESLAVFRLPNVLVACVLIPLIRKTKYFYMVLTLIILSLVSIVIHYSPQKISDQNIYRLYQKNLSFLIKNTDPLKADILKANVDFITLQEVTKKNVVLMSDLKANFPYQHSCPFTSVGGVSVLSRWPDMGESKCYGKDGMSAMRVETSEGPVWLISIHLYWPYPYGQSKQVKKLVKYINELDGPKIIAGDFNMVPWSHTLNAFKRASDTHMAGPTHHSLKLPYIPMTIPIDHILVPSGANATTQRRAKKGSDHFGVMAEFNMR